MPTLAALIPEVDVLLSLTPAELAPYVLEAIKSQMQAGRYHEGNGILYGLFAGGFGVQNAAHAYPIAKQQEVELAVAEAVAWLKVNQLLITAPGQDGTSGNLVLSRRAKSLSTEGFQNFVAASAFPKSLLHPIIADDVWSRILRGELDIAVFIAFRTVEEQVRSAGGFNPTDFGVELMRRAFHELTGPLTKTTDPLPERQALAHLFAGAIGSYKNPHSHRTVAISEAGEAQEMVLLASHLLRIIDSRRPEAHGG